MIKNGKRQSIAEVFIRPAMHRPNLHVLPNALVTKVGSGPASTAAQKPFLFQVTLAKTGGRPRATGVEFICKNVKRKALARREVIVSAGAVNSPQLLMLSGIGPKEHLQSLGIPVIVDNAAVGSNLHDHPFSHIVFAMNESVGGEIVSSKDGWRFALSLLQWYLLGSGKERTPTPVPSVISCVFRSFGEQSHRHLWFRPFKVR